MDKKQLDEFKELLERNLEELKSTHDVHLDSLLKIKHRSEIESADWGQQLEDEIVEEHIVTSDEQFARKIVKALQRMKAGTYGKCEACQCEIPIDRLKAKPSVSLCLGCQEKKDSGSLVM